MRIKTRIVYTRPPEVLARTARAAIVEGYDAAIKAWQREMLPRHFEGSARTRYGYTSRDPKYLERKRRFRGGDNDIVWSGATKRKALTSSPLISGGAKRRTLKLLVPDYVSIRRRSGLHLAAELTRLTSDELPALARVTQSHIDKRLGAITERRTVNL